MCASCGCGDPENDHGDKRHILLSQVVSAAQAANLDLHNATQNIHDMAKGQVPIEEIKKLLTPDNVKDWAEWDAEREAEEAGESVINAVNRGRGMKDRVTSAAKERENRMRDRRTGIKGPKDRNRGQNNRGRGKVGPRTMMRVRALNNHIPNGHGLTGGALASLLRGLGSKSGGRGSKPDNDKVKLNAIHNVLHVVQPNPTHSHDSSHRAQDTAQNSNPGVGKLLKGIIKRLQKDETGRFTGSAENVHSHRQQDESIVTHTHDGEKGHTHPGRNYGPSFHHR